MQGTITFVGGETEIGQYARTIIEKAYNETDTLLLPRITVIIQEVGTAKSDKRGGSVNREDSSTMLIDLYAMTTRKEGSLRQRIRGIFFHEYAHLLQQHASASFLVWKEHYDRLVSKIPPGKAAEDFGNLRVRLLLFREKLLQEGVARFLEQYLDENLRADLLPTAEKQFLSHYKEWHDNAEAIYLLMKRLMRKAGEGGDGPEQGSDRWPFRELEWWLERAPYDIGKAMVIAILYLEPTVTIEQLLELDPDAFLLLYERIMQSHNYRPLVSFGPAGCFSYGGALKTLVESYQRFAANNPAPQS